MRILPDPSKARRFLGYLDWLYNPFGRWEVTQVYDLLSTDVATAHGLYLNLGYWTGEEKTLDEACRGLADLLARQAEMGPGDRILDLGFGFADQDIHWMETYRPAHILGLNLTASQVAVARQRVEALGHAERIELREGSATDIPLASGSVDTVLALECAFHFRTRERFFAEALRVLRPGGRLVTADIIPLPDASDRLRRLKQRASWRLVASRFAIPARMPIPPRPMPSGSPRQASSRSGWTPSASRSMRHCMSISRDTRAHSRDCTRRPDCRPGLRLA